MSDLKPDKIKSTKSEELFSYKNPRKRKRRMALVPTCQCDLCGCNPNTNLSPNSSYESIASLASSNK
jgi:hypothetical protein